MRKRYVRRLKTTAAKMELIMRFMLPKQEMMLLSTAVSAQRAVKAFVFMLAEEMAPSMRLSMVYTVIRTVKLR